MSAQSNVAPIIIKRKKVSGGDGHHGGAWKVAYADFVTAMMAFFLLMWLLNATTEQQRKGLADYFTPTVPINRISGGGNGAFSGDSVFTESTQARNGTGGLPPMVEAADENAGLAPMTTSADGEKEDQFGEVEDMLIGNGGESMIAENAMKHVLTRQTDEGLVIEIFDLENSPLFVEGEDIPTRLLVDLARVIAEAFQLINNDVALGGHTRSEPVVVANNTVWALSTARADRMRLLLESHGVEASRMARVTGHADREVVDFDPLSTRNNRIEIVLLRSDQQE